MPKQWKKPMMKFIYRVCAHFGLSTPRQLRLWWLRIFRQSYVVDCLLSRKGECTNGNCALVCCKGCPWLIKKGKKFFCKDYKNAPLGCKEFPIDQKELEMRNQQLSKENLEQYGFF